MGSAIRAALALFLCLKSGAAFAAGAAGVTAMPVGQITTTPIGWIMFCRENAGECRPAPGMPAAPVAATDRFLELASEINARFNKSIEPMTDEKLYGVEERWTYPTTKGDCEDFALAKRRALHEEAGVPMANLLLTVVRKKDGEGHAVLTLRTAGGDFVLDNLDKWVRPWDEVRYTFVKRQSSIDPNAWQSVVSRADVAVGSLSR